ncbi:MAG: hypothetical protein HC850_04275 [Rhodomicrobium sp.]|nr:hypothetical protein [Rhodomicrobium sp.]
MKTALTMNARRALTVALIAAPVLILQGCYEDDYLARRDTISLGAGDANATNAATHTIDPWPAHAKNTDIDLDGKRAEIAADRYRQNKSIPPRGLTTSDVAPASPNGGANGPVITN